jgi:hypothetical protein
MLSKSRILDCGPLCLRATGAGIREIDFVSPARAGALDLFVSQNEIEHLTNVTQFRSLRRLMISYNRISRIEDLFPLIELHNLKEVNLEGNPVSRLPLFFLHVFYMLPKLQILNGRKRQDFFKGRISSNEVGRYVEAEASLLRWLATADLILDVLAMAHRPAIRGLSAYFNDHYPPGVFAKYSHEIRCQAEGFRSEKYLAFLKDLLAGKHRKINEVGAQANLDRFELSRREELLSSAPTENDLDADLLRFGQLNDSLAKLVEVKPRSASKMSDIFSMAGSRSVMGSRSVYSRHQKTPTSRDTQSLVEGREAQEMMNQLSVAGESPHASPGRGARDEEPVVDGVLDEEAPIEEPVVDVIAPEKIQIEDPVEIPLPYPVKVLENPREATRAFVVWKKRFHRAVHAALPAAEASGDVPPAVETGYNDLSFEEHCKRVRDCTDRHELMRKIELMQDVNERSRGRYVQIRSEMEAAREFSVHS